MRKSRPSESETALNSSSFLKQMGPAWIVSAVACGPATMASVSLAGALFGYQLLWVVILSALLAFVAQFMAAKLGIVTGKGIIALVDQRLGNTWGWILMIDALLATWLASTILMKAFVDVTALITGLTSPWWSLLYATFVFLIVGMGGYKLLEWVCKVLVSIVVLCFIITVLVVTPDLTKILKGLIPTIPGGIDSALMMAGIMGGAVHITIIAMHTYNVNSKGWGQGQMKLAWMDTFFSMFIAFGLYSVAIFLATASALHPENIKITSAMDLAKALKPFLGPYAGAVFLAGLWGAVLTTITPTFLAAGYFLSDKMGWELNVKDPRFKAVVFVGCLLSLIGPMLKGSFLFLLVLMLALGLCGTPFIIIIIILLLNKKDVVRDYKNSLVLNALGVLTLLVTSLLAIRFILSKLGLWG
ncbi:MAG: Nramp family divalent metal transporter [Deltaproteobacteria bacterium]|nr:Nramp family divalent metal transporter [Deltaproteobacteria bacterium]